MKGKQNKFINFSNTDRIEGSLQGIRKKREWFFLSNNESRKIELLAEYYGVTKSEMLRDFLSVVDSQKLLEFLKKYQEPKRDDQ